MCLCVWDDVDDLQEEGRRPWCAITSFYSLTPFLCLMIWHVTFFIFLLPFELHRVFLWCSLWCWHVQEELPPTHATLPLSYHVSHPTIITQHSLLHLAVFMSFPSNKGKEEAEEGSCPSPNHPLNGIYFTLATVRLMVTRQVIQLLPVYGLSHDVHVAQFIQMPPRRKRKKEVTTTSWQLMAKKKVALKKQVVPSPWILESGVWENSGESVMLWGDRLLLFSLDVYIYTFFFTTTTTTTALRPPSYVQSTVPSFPSL